MPWPHLSEDFAENKEKYPSSWGVDKARSREFGGTGLGLSIARWAVEANGGRLELARREGQGSLFRITLPRTDPPKSREASTCREGTSPPNPQRGDIPESLTLCPCWRRATPQLLAARQEIGLRD